MSDSPTVFEQLARRLDESRATYSVTRHTPVFTSEEAAKIRGTSLSSGAKALVCKVDDSFRLFVLPANLKLDGKKARKACAGKSLRFASRDEVLKLTSLQPGSIPPFGSLFDLPTICDQRLADEPEINFNAGDHCISVQMPFREFARVENPQTADVAESSTPSQ